MILFKAIHHQYLNKWQDYSKTSSYRHGARWNHATIPAMYTSQNVQNAMLEIANYTLSPAMANSLYKIAIFEFPELRLQHIEPAQLPKLWSDTEHKVSVKDLGSKWLTDPDYQGIVVPTASIHPAIATHPINAVRASVYANTVVNVARVGVQQIKLLDAISPIYANSMFNVHQ